MPNAKELIKTINKSICLYGPSGSGKTTAFTTIPGKKFMYTFDPSGLDSLAGLDINYKHFPRDKNLGILKTQKGRIDPRGVKKKEPTAYMNFENHLDTAMIGDFDGYDVIGFDSVTSLQRILMDRLLFINGRFGAVPELPDYNLLGLTLMHLFSSVAQSNKTIVIIAHDDLVQNAINKKIVNQLNATKTVRKELPTILTDYWVTNGERSGDGAVYNIQTSPSKEYPDCKNSLRLKHFEGVTINMDKPREGQGIGRWFV